MKTHGVISFCVSVLVSSAMNASASQLVSPVIDGTVTPGEYANARHESLAGGGELSVLRQGEVLYVAVVAEKKGLASLCVGNNDRVSILHASAALGTATYERVGERWLARTRFQFGVRDSPRNGPAPESERIAFLESNGWLANSSNAGSPVREYRIALRPEWRYIGFVFVHIEEPMSVSYFPSTMKDDCRALRISLGSLPDEAQFDPATWIRVP